MQSGWIKLHRSIMDWEWYEDQNTFRLFLHILLTANHADKNWRGIMIKKGQKLTSQLKLSEQTGLTRQQVRTCLNRLESTNEITMQSTAQNTMITVLQWDKYQEETNESTNEQPTANHQSTTNKNVKNEKNIKTITPAKPKYEDIDLKFATQAFELIKQNNPDHKEPNLKSWASDVRKMREIDKRDLNEMARVWTWIRQDHFWSTNILSISKFREKYDQLKLKSNQVNDYAKHERPTAIRPDNSAAGRVRQIAAKRRAEIAAQIAETGGNDRSLAANEFALRSQVDE